MAYGSSQAGVKSELQLLAYTTAMATPDPSHVCDLHRILNPLSEARDQTTSSWILVGFSTAESQQELPRFIYLFIYLFIYFVFLPLREPLPQHMEVPRLGVESEL